MASSGKYKNTVELQDAYEEYIAKLPPSQRNKLLQGIGSKGADRIQAAANDFAVNRNGKNLPIPKRSWDEIAKHQKQQKEKINKILSASKKKKQMREMVRNQQKNLENQNTRKM